MGDALEGTDQPGIPRSARQRGRERRKVLENPRGDATRVLERVAELVGVKRLCIWPHSNISIQVCWNKLQRALGEELSRVKKVVRVRQRNFRIRFDVYVEQEARDRVLETLVTLRSMLGFWVRRHKNYFEIGRAHV